ncbi:MAG: glycyl-radical enzyme activating protein [Spirochaetia bacterium]|nr:glycyl-radical enzyme activating protein [Spirochaetia bacterium]
MQMKGLVFDIKEMAIFDGPGIRTTVFLKGCPLECSWCHNPEGISPNPILMVSSLSCIHCGACERACPHPSQCISCGTCVSGCPLNLRKIAGTYYQGDELATILLKDRAILESNGGGVTFSGGEPLMQPSFVLEVIHNLKGLHCAIETSGYAPLDIFKSVIDAVDYVIMDIKMIDPQLHRKYCKQDNALILQNLEYLKISGKPFVIRIPVIPNVNDNHENYIKTALLLKDTPTLEKVELLPYQKTAGAKYKMIHTSYNPGFDETIAPFFDTGLFKKMGIRCEVL